VSDSAKDLLTKLLVVDVHSRITADSALKHLWIWVSFIYNCCCLQCFDAVGWAAGRAFGL